MASYRSFLLLLLLLLLGACSSVPENPSPAGGPDVASAPRGTSQGSGDRSKGDTEKADEDRGDDGSSKSSGDPANGGGDKGGRPGGDPEDPALGSSSVTDPARDLDSHGDPPGYVDLTSIDVVDSAEGVSVMVGAAAPFPAKMPDLETNALMVVGFEKGGDEYFIQGAASTDGWSTTMSRNGRQVEYQGGFGHNGKRLTFQVPWTDLGGAGPFRWSVDSSWTRTTTLDTFYGFDRAPQFGRERFPN